MRGLYEHRDPLPTAGSAHRGVYPWVSERNDWNLLYMQVRERVGSTGENLLGWWLLALEEMAPQQLNKPVPCQVGGQQGREGPQGGQGVVMQRTEPWALTSLAVWLWRGHCRSWLLTAI